MNAISLYVSTSRLVLQSNGDSKNITDLYRLLPYLRQSLSCKVCGNLLNEPHSPNSSKCQHHVCKECINDIKKLTTSCIWCCEKQNFVENRQLRILLQCYKSLCKHIISIPLYQEIRKNNSSASSLSITTNSVLDLIEEGVKYQDDYNNHSVSVAKPSYSILPCLYTTTNSSTQTFNNTNNILTTASSNMPIFSLSQSIPTISTFPSTAIKNEKDNRIKIYQQPITIQRQLPTRPLQIQQHPQPVSQQVTNSTSVYSVLYAGSGNKITIKRKLENSTNTPTIQQVQSTQNSIINPIPIPSNFKKPTPSPVNIFKQKLIAPLPNLPQHLVPAQSFTTHQSMISGPVASKRKGCRCGNATLTPGKLTCCGQRCPCYVESKPCIDCKCRGCRNPHHPNGFKVRPHIPNSLVVSNPTTLQPTVIKTYTTSTIAPPSSSASQIFIGDLSQIQLNNNFNPAISTNPCMQITQFLRPTNFNHLLNNAIIFNPGDIPTIIDGGSIPAAEISIDL